MLLLFLITLAHYFGLSYKWYHQTWWVDFVMHAIGGMWIAAASFTVKDAYIPELQKIAPLWLYVLVILGIVMLAGVMWEWIEFLLDLVFFPLRAELRLQLGLMDTLKDLAMDFLGGLAMTLVIAFGERRSYLIDFDLESQKSYE